jgi:enolase-phosphatase E1
LIRAVVTDIEGTTSSLSVVKDLLFPYARRHLREFVKRRGDEPEVRAALEETRRLEDAPHATDAETLRVLERWIDEDRKATPLKALQGLLWEEGYRKGELRSHVYADVAPALRKLRSRDLPLYVYSSGSVRAQHVFFEHTNEGNLRGLFAGYFDTTTGPKNEPESYRTIARAIGLAPGDVLFLTDARAELDAASAAGFQVIGVSREAVPSLAPYPAVTTFGDFAMDADGESVAFDGAVVDALLTFARSCHERGWALATSGNFSVRIGETHLAVTASGRHKGRLTRDDIAVVGLGAGARGSGAGTPEPTPSAETPLHQALYRRFPHVGAVAHTHSVAATVLSRRSLAEGFLNIAGYEMQKALAGVRSHDETVALPIVENSQDMPALVRAVDDALERFPAAFGYLVAGHGLTTWAKDVATLERHVEALEFVLACELAEGQ